MTTKQKQSPHQLGDTIVLVQQGRVQECSCGCARMVFIDHHTIECFGCKQRYAR